MAKSQKTLIQRIRSIRARARTTAYGHLLVHFFTLSGFWFKYIEGWIDDEMGGNSHNSSSGTVIAFDEMFATFLIFYSCWILKEATFKYNLASIRIWLEINGIYFAISIGLKYLVYILRNPNISRELFLISAFRAAWEAYAILIVYLFYKDQKALRPKTSPLAGIHNATFNQATPQTAAVVNVGPVTGKLPI